MGTQTACSTTNQPTFAVHTVSADFRGDSPDLEVLEFHYGQAKKGPGGLQRSAAPGSGGVPSPSIGGDLPLPDQVTVKWRDKRTDKVYEETVDMASRLPGAKAMNETTVYFLVDQFENKLYVYLVPATDYKDRSVGRRPEGTVPNGPSKTAHLDVKTLYPDNSPPRPRGRFSKSLLKLWGVSPEGLIVP
ncbi:hypothetical protein [Hydrogenophaga sp. 5NK40-0174]|uniref:hypothetical protein n=1 Tax=Hydrogenophaga sp. 5NK40-0174 TaxID=3127649 RepID=UPI00333FF04C